MELLLQLFLVIPFLGYLISLFVAPKREKTISKIAFGTLSIQLTFVVIFTLFWLYNGLTTINLKEFSIYKSDNYDFFMEFNNKWFIYQSCLFDGLDLGWPEDIDDLISERIGETEDEITEVKFEDGSIMKFLDSNDTVCSFYVLESDFTLLKTEIETIVNKFE